MDWRPSSVQCGLPTWSDPLRKFIVLAVLLSLVTAACSSTPAVVATIGGTTQITEADLGDLFETKAVPVDTELRDAIFALTALEILLQGMRADFGLELDQAGVDTMMSQLTAQRDGAGLSTADFLGVPNAGEGMLRFDAELVVLRRQVVDALVTAPSFIDEVMATPTLITRVCSAHVLVATEEEAQGVLDRLRAGEAIATVADEVSLDTGVGGDLGCRIAGEYVDEFAVATIEAPIGEPYGPIETLFGWHVLIVSERTAPTRDEVAADPVAVIPVSEATAIWQEWFNDKLRAADVVVEAKYGTWSATGIVPPG